MSEKPPLLLPRYMVEDWGIFPNLPDGYSWEFRVNYEGWEAVPITAGTEEQ